jgi:predicted dehydrogenase
MHGQAPIAVTAVVRHYRPDVYPKVDDDATIIVEYPGATGQIEASWNWPFGIKDMEIFGERGYLHALNGNDLTMRMRENIKSTREVKPIPAPYDDPINYYTAVLQKKISGEEDLSSLKYNMIVMEILDAAKRSAKEGKRIVR